MLLHGLMNAFILAWTSIVGNFSNALVVILILIFPFPRVQYLCLAIVALLVFSLKPDWFPGWSYQRTQLGWISRQR